MKTVHSYLYCLIPLFLSKCFHFLIQFIQLPSNLNMIRTCVFRLCERSQHQTSIHQHYLFNKVNTQFLEKAGILEHQHRRVATRINTCRVTVMSSRNLKIYYYETYDIIFYYTKKISYQNRLSCQMLFNSQQKGTAKDLCTSTKIPNI